MNMNLCLKWFGRENFELLNDVVNKVDSMISTPFLQALQADDKTNQDVVEYYRQLDKLNQVYADMAEHSKKYKLETQSR